MKRQLKYFVFCSTATVGMILFLFSAALVFEPFGTLLFSTLLGNIYRKVGETVMTTDGRKTETLAIYKAYGKPYLIVGPCVFHETNRYGRNEWTDFFFVNPREVIRTSIDKGGDAWVRLPWLLFMVDDLTIEDRLRLPYWDDLEHKGSSVRYDEATASYVYRLWINHPKEPVTFAIPSKFFTQDLLDAPRPAWN